MARLSLHPNMCDCLERLVATGRYGNSVPEAATPAIRAGLEPRLDVESQLTRLADEGESEQRADPSSAQSVAA